MGRFGSLVLLVAGFASGASAGTLELQRISTGTIIVDVEAGTSGQRSFQLGLNDGKILVNDPDNGGVLATPFLDRIPDPDGNNAGIFAYGLALAPDYDTSGLMYLSYATRGDVRHKVLEMRRDATNPNIVDPTSIRQIFEVNHPEATSPGAHIGGAIDFGPDGMLYITTGDGDLETDGTFVAQDVTDGRGKVFRIDPTGDDLPGDSRNNFSIPSDNPDFGTGALPGMWAMGLRNPFKAQWDPVTNRYFIADVGEDLWEEINLGEAGANYEWSNREGPSAGLPLSPLSTEGTPTGPLYAYPHELQPFGGRSVTGGFVARLLGPGFEALEGQYLFGDYGSDRPNVNFPRDSLWSFDPSLNTVTTDDVTRWTIEYSNGGTLFGVLGFGQDASGGVYITDITGDVFQVTSASPNVVPLPATGLVLLSGLGWLAWRRRAAISAP